MRHWQKMVIQLPPENEYILVGNKETETFFIAKLERKRTKNGYVRETYLLTKEGRKVRDFDNLYWMRAKWL